MHNKCYSELKLRLNTPKKFMNRLPFNLVLHLDYNLQTEHSPRTFLTHLAYIYIFSIAVRPTVSGFVPLPAANREYTGWLKDRVLKPARKLSLVVTFIPSESSQPDQIADRIKELYTFFFENIKAITILQELYYLNSK